MARFPSLGSTRGRRQCWTQGILEVDNRPRQTRMQIDVSNEVVQGLYEASAGVHPFYREFWDPYGIRSLVGAKVAEDEDVMTMIGIIRSFEQHSFSAAEVQLAQRYFSHQIAALRVAKHLRKLHIAANAREPRHWRRPSPVLEAPTTPRTPDHEEAH